MATRLDHCNIRTFDLDRTIRFYSDVVGPKDGGLSRYAVHGGLAL